MSVYNYFLYRSAPEENSVALPIKLLVPLKSSTNGVARSIAVWLAWKNGLVTLLHARLKVNCEALGKGDRWRKFVIPFGKETASQTWVSAELDHIFLKNWSHIVDEYSNDFCASSEEKNSYILVVHNNVRQVLRLLKVIYRPHNLYCIHPDAKQEPKFIRAFQAISQCLDNMFVASSSQLTLEKHQTFMFHVSKWHDMTSIISF